MCIWPLSQFFFVKKDNLRMDLSLGYNLKKFLAINSSNLMVKENLICFQFGFSILTSSSNYLSFQKLWIQIKTIVQIKILNAFLDIFQYFSYPRNITSMWSIIFFLKKKIKLKKSKNFLKNLNTEHVNFDW